MNEPHNVITQKQHTVVMVIVDSGKSRVQVIQDSASSWNMLNFPWNPINITVLLVVDSGKQTAHSTKLWNEDNGIGNCVNTTAALIANYFSTQAGTCYWEPSWSKDHIRHIENSNLLIRQRQLPHYLIIALWTQVTIHIAKFDRTFQDQWDLSGPNWIPTGQLYFFPAGCCLDQVLRWHVIIQMKRALRRPVGTC